MSMKHLGAGLLAIALGLAGPAWAGPEEDRARQDLERARQEVEKARTELQKATRELARSMAKAERDNPRAQYFEYMTNPDRAVLGVLIPDASEDQEPRGVRLTAITPGSGAEKAGLKAGDLVLALNGESLAGDGKKAPSKRMKAVIQKLKAGDEVRVDYERDGRQRSTTVKTTAPEPETALAQWALVQDWMQDDALAPMAPFAPIPKMAMYQFRSPAIRGLELAKLDEDLGSYFKTREGVLVVKAPRSSALGLKSGDVIQKIDGTPVAEPLTVLDLLRSRGDEQTVKIELLRQGRKQEVTGKIPVADARERMRKDQRRRVEVIRPQDVDPDDGG